MARDTVLLSPNKSFAANILSILLPFFIAVAALYSALIFYMITFAEDSIVESYLAQEQASYRERHSESTVAPPLPSTSYLKGRWHSQAGWATQYSNLAPGIHEVTNGRHVAVGEIDGERLYLELNEQRFTSLDQYRALFRTVLLLTAGLVILAGVSTAIVIARRIASPVTALAEDAASGWQEGKEFFGSRREDEIGQLSRRLNSLVLQLHETAEREKSFTRHASHEMRTPVGIILNALSVVRLPDLGEDKRERNLDRIEQACSDIERVIDVFLCLGDRHRNLPTSQVNLADVIHQQMTRHETLIKGRSLAVSITDESSMQVICAPSLLEVAIANLFRNAVTHGEEAISIQCENNAVKFSNARNPGPQSTNGYGYGLEIVERICQHCGWNLSVEPTDNRFDVTISFDSTASPTATPVTPQ